MKQLIVIVSTLLLILSSTSTMAEGQQNGQRQGKSGNGNREAKMQQRLGLTDEQIARMKEIRQNGGSKEDMRAVLTDEQRATMFELRRQRSAQRYKVDSDQQTPSAGDGEPAEPNGG